jgi:hypothetical protein
VSRYQGIQPPNFASGVLDNLKVRDVTTMKGRKKIIRRVLVGDVAGQVAPRDAELPRNLLAFVAANCDQPEPGEYKAKIIQIGPASWAATLEVLSCNLDIPLLHGASHFIQNLPVFGGSPPSFRRL